MAVIAIIGVLAGVITVSVVSIKTRSRDKAAMVSMESTRLLTSKCLKSGLSDVRLGFPAPMWGEPDVMCYQIPPVTVVGFPEWPIVKDGWEYGWCTDSTCFYFCAPGYSGGSAPPFCPAGYDNYADGVCGGNRANGSFCYALRNGSKYIWCTETGCKKQGF
ncbi:MAG: hypothetical protein UY41_C0003G0040 [Candidatus Moranbacteria bacterium GW2011_GWE1_49_15]|nr:MAG: hypothetical protein UY41_C0003G0040 [Candidatus Moranbacteria bacterium GW2011_GWE1_49_15]